MNKTKLFLSMFVTFALAFSACTNITDPDDKTKKTLPFSETFETGIGDFTTQSVSGDQVWTQSAQYKCMVMTGFVNPTNNANEDWLISPEISLAGVDSAKLSFEHAGNYFNDVSASISVWISENYVDGLPSTATWTQLPIAKTVSNSDFTFVKSENSLTSYAGKKVKIAFKYVSTTTKAGTWEIKNFVVDEGEVETEVSINSSAVTTATIGEVYTYAITTELVNPTGTTVITATGIPAWATFTDNANGTATITGTPLAVGTHEISIQATNNLVSITQDYTLTVSNAPTSPNLVANGSFEDWAAGIPTGGWYVVGSTPPTGYTITPETTVVLDGATSCKLDVPSSASGTISWSQPVTIVAGKTYQLSMSYYILSGDGSDARIWCNFKTGTTFFSETQLVATTLYSVLRGPGNTNQSGSSYFPDEKGAWKTYTTTFTAPDGADGFDFQFRTYKGAVVYWDKMSLKEI